MSTLEIQSIKSHFSNVLKHYNNLKKKFVEESNNELEFLHLQLIELKNKINNLSMQSSIIYFLEAKELLSTIEKGIFDLDDNLVIPETEIIIPQVSAPKLEIVKNQAKVSSTNIVDVQSRLIEVIFKLKTNINNIIEQKQSTNFNEPVLFSSILTPGQYLVEAIYSYRLENEIGTITVNSNSAVIEENLPLPPEPPVPSDIFATVKLSSSQSWGNGFSAEMEIESHSDINLAGDWALNFDSSASSLSHWQINCDRKGNQLSITSGKDWAQVPHFSLTPFAKISINGINGNGVAFDKNIMTNATINGYPVKVLINGEESGGTNPNPTPEPEPEIPTISFPDQLPILGATDVEAIYLTADKNQILGTVSIPNPQIHSEYAIYVNNFKAKTKVVEFTRRSSMVNVQINKDELFLSNGNNKIELVFAGTANSKASYYKTNSVEIFKEKPENLGEKSLIGYWSSWGGNGPTSYIDLEDVPSEYDTIVVSFIEHMNDFLTPQFDPEASKQVTKEAFKDKVKRMKAKGHDVIIAIGGQNGVFKLKSETEKNIFKSGVINIIEEYGFNGFDIDLEGQSTQYGSTFIVQAIKEIILHFRAKDPNFIYSMAPEVAYLMSTGFGSLYIDLIRETKDLITTIHPQYYNAPGTGVYPFDGSGVAIDCKNQARFIPEFTQALIKGHDGPAWGGEYAQLFPIGPIPEEKLAIGLPSGVGAAGTGAINDMEIIKSAWLEVQRRGYTNVKGFMTWSIDWDKYHNWQFKNAVSELIK